MATNLSTIATATTAIGALSKLVLVSPQSTVGYQPVTSFDNNGNPVTTVALPPSLLFNYEGENTAQVESDITDHYIEDNTAVQDQIALRPEVVTVQGYIGELNDVLPPSLQFLKTIEEKLTLIGPYQPQLTITAIETYNTAFAAYQATLAVANAASSIVNNFSNTGNENLISSSGLGGAFNAQAGTVSDSQNAQQTAFQLFYGYWRSRTIFRVQTPWAIFDNMVIQSLRAIQDAETNVISTFEVRFKMLRTVSSISSVTTPIAGISSGRLIQQSSDEVNQGTVGAQSTNETTPGMLSTFSALS